MTKVGFEPATSEQATVTMNSNFIPTNMKEPTAWSNSSEETAFDADSQEKTSYLIWII